MPQLKTARLLLRQWRPADRAPFAALNADPKVMEHFPATLAKAESDAMADRITAHFERHGFGLWALEVPGVVDFAGFVGLNVPIFDAPFMPCAEIGWRLAVPHWGHGYAQEAAREVLRWAFVDRKLPEIVSFTVPGNVRSRHVMEAIGMVRNEADDFDHPLVPVGNPRRRHVLYRITAPLFRPRAAG